MSTATAPVGAPDVPKHVRPYVVLEQESIASVIDRLFPEQFPDLPDDVIAELEHTSVYTNLATVVARNAEHACRRSAAQANATEDPVLVPIAQKMWAPQRVPVSREPRVGKPEAVR